MKSNSLGLFKSYKNSHTCAKLLDQKLNSTQTLQKGYVKSQAFRKVQAPVKKKKTFKLSNYFKIMN